MSLGLGSNLSKSGLVTPGIVTDNLVLKHKYDAASVVPISDGAAYFDGTDDYIAIPETTYDVDGGEVSFTFWIKILDNSVQNLVMSANPNLKNINMHSNGTMYIETNTNEDLASAPFTQDSNWHHYAITCNSGTVAMYEDGKALAMGDNAITDDITFNKISSSTSKVFNGYMCNLGIWTGTALTQPQIKSIMNKNYAGLTDSEKTNLTSWWNLDTTLGGSGGTSVVVNSHDNTLGEELITGFVNGSTYAFDTLTTSGRNISAAVETSGDWAGAASNSLNLVEGEIYKCTFNLTYNSGTDTVRVLLANSANGAATSVVDEVYYTNTNGVNEAYFRVKTTDSESFLQIGTWHSSDVINFNMTDISLKRLGGTTGKLS